MKNGRWDAKRDEILGAKVDEKMDEKVNAKVGETKRDAKLDSKQDVIFYAKIGTQG